MLKATLCAAVQLLPPGAKVASAASHDHQNGAQLSQELPSFHDWGDPSHAPSTAAPPAATAEGPAAVPAVPAATADAQEAAALSHQAASLLSHPTSAQPNIHAQPSSTLLPPQLQMQLPPGEVGSEEAEWQLGGDADGQERSVLAAPELLDTSTSGDVAEASYGATIGSEGQGTLSCAAKCIKFSAGS